MQTKHLYLFLLTLISCANLCSMEKQHIKLLMPEGLVFPVEDIWLSIIAQCSAKWKLRETCRYFRDFASIANDKIFLQNPLVMKPDLLKGYALCYAQLNHDAIIINLLNQGLSPNLADDNYPENRCLLDYAVLNENMTMINILSKHPDFITHNLRGSFRLALQQGFLEIAKHMLTADTVDMLTQAYIDRASDQNIDVLKQILSLKHTPLSSLLCRAARNDHIKLTKFLLDRGANVHGLSNHSQSPVYCAVQYPRILKLLIDHGANINHDNPTPLASNLPLYTHFTGIQFLINQGASLVTQPGEEPLLIKAIGSTFDERCIQLVQLLLSKGVDVNERSIDNNTALFHAAHYNRIEIIPLLLAHPNIDVNATNNNGETPLDKAILKYYYYECQNSTDSLSTCNNIIKLLTEHGGKTGAELAQTDERK